MCCNVTVAVTLLGCCLVSLTPTPSPSYSPSPSPFPSASVTPSPTFTPTPSPSLTPTPTPSPPALLVYNGVPWLDTNGSRIWATGGHMQKFGSLWHWYGESQKTDNVNALSAGFNLYTSSDLIAWDFRGMVFDNSSLPSFPGTTTPLRLERPRVLYNPTTSQYVMWFHLDTYSWELCKSAVAISNSSTGPFTYYAAYTPGGLCAYDPALYQEGASAWLIVNQAVGLTRPIYIYPLSPDYLGINGTGTLAPGFEGQSLWKYDGAYWMMGSFLSGWSPNPTQQARTLAINGSAVWTDYLIPAIGDNQPNGNGGHNGMAAAGTTFNSQPTYVFEYSPGKWLMMADRWNAAGPGGIQNATYVWFPLNTACDFTFIYRDVWDLNAVYY